VTSAIGPETDLIFILSAALPPEIDTPKMASLLRNLSYRFTGTPSADTPSADFTKAKTEDSLFPKTDPAIDGDDCLEDCSSCSIRYPRKFEIEEDDKLYGNIAAWSTHIIVATGKTDWVRDVGDEKGSVMEAVAKADEPTNGVSHSPSSGPPQDTDISVEDDALGLQHAHPTLLTFRPRRSGPHHPSAPACLQVHRQCHPSRCPRPHPTLCQHCSHEYNSFGRSFLGHPPDHHTLALRSRDEVLSPQLLDPAVFSCYKRCEMWSIRSTSQEGVRKTLAAFGPGPRL
jgi:hypothetical protein